jgi:hypothetical protein
MKYEQEPNAKRPDSDDLIDYQAPSVYAPNARRYTELQLPPGVSPEALVCYASIDGQD